MSRMIIHLAESQPVVIALLGASSCGAESDGNLGVQHWLTHQQILTSSRACERANRWGTEVMPTVIQFRKVCTVQSVDSGKDYIGPFQPSIRKSAYLKDSQNGGVSVCPFNN